MHDDIRNGMASALWATSWASWAEENGVNLSGRKIEDVMHPVPPEVDEVVLRYVAKLKQKQGLTLGKIWDHFRLSGLDRSQCGHYLIMEALGSGVGLWEYRDHPFKFPLIEAHVFNAGGTLQLEASF